MNEWVDEWTNERTNERMNEWTFYFWHKPIDYTRAQTTHSKERTREWAKKYAVVLRVVTSSIMDQFKEIPLWESLLNFQKDVFY